MTAELVWVLMSFVAQQGQITYGPAVKDLASCERMQKAALVITAGRYYEGHKCVQIYQVRDENKPSISVTTQPPVVIVQTGSKKKR